MVFHFVQALVSPPVKGVVRVSLIVRASNSGDQDFDAIVKATLVRPDGTTVATDTKQREIEEGQKNKDIQIEFNVPEGALPPDVSCRLEFSIS